MASPIKDMLRSVGLREDQVEGTGKEIPCQLLCDKTPRYAMQTLGTEWGRNIIGENIWVNLWSNKVQELTSMNQNVVADDVRFINEVNIIRGLGGKIIRIHRPNSNAKPMHDSEKQEFLADFTINNNGTVEDVLKHIPVFL